jgi:hypothetical protein
VTCLSGYYLYNTSAPSCLNPCPTGLFMNVGTGTCTGCMAPCSTCGNFSNQCLSCNSSMVLQGSVCQNNCNIGFYALSANCLVCPSVCSSCISNLSCTACASGYYLYINSCITQCPASFPVITSSGSCAACSDPACMSCDYLNRCSNCSYPKLLLGTTCVSSCPADFSLVNGTKCIYNATQAVLSSSLASSSIFPVPFTIAAAFVAVACLMSHFQNQRTFVPGALYGLWGLL